LPNVPRERTVDDTLITVAQAAALLGVHPNTIRSWTDAGRLAAFRINARGDRRYRQGDVERLLAEGAAAQPTLEAAPPVSETQRDAELAVLARLAQGAASVSSTAAVCRMAVEAIRSRFDYQRIAVYLADKTGFRLETHAGYRIAPPARVDAPADVNAPLTESFRHPAEESLREAIPLTELHLPLRAAGSTVGILVIEDDPSGPLAAAHVPFLRTVGNALAVAIHSSQLLARARRELTRARALRSVTHELTGTLDLSLVLNDIIERTRGLFDADKAGLWLIEEGEHPFRLVAARDISDAFRAHVAALDIDSPSLGVYAVRDRRTYVIRDADVHGGVGLMRETYAIEGIKTACLVPLVAHDHALGVLGLYHDAEHDWPEEELALAQAFANQAAVAISNARLYRSAADQAARMRSIQDLSARLNRLTDVQAIADAIVIEASALAEYHDIRIYQVNWTTRMCEPVAYTRRLLGDGDFRERLRVPVGAGSFTGTVAETGEPLLINDALADTRGTTIEGTDEIDESMLVVPMLFEERAVGVLALSRLGVDQFSEHDLQTMSIFAGYAAQALANASAYERLEQQSAELERQLDSQRRLLEINEQLLGSLDHASVFELIADGLRSVVHYDNLSIYRADHAHQILTPVLTRERHAEQVARYIVPFGHGLMGWAVNHAEAVMANDALADPRVKQIPGTPDDPEALIVVPLISDGQVTGSLNISRVGGGEVYFSQNDFEIIKLFAAQASIALRNADAHQEVRVRADTDALTGLGNHGAFQRSMSEALDHALEVDAGGAGQPVQPVALLMMDLDNFKPYNDRLGHPAGDALLHAVGVAIQSAARSDDLVYRYGGDEFALILSGVGAENAPAIAERVRQAVARLTAKELTPVTITIGVATHPDAGEDKNDLIAAADIALYYGKQSGGDRVVSVGEVPAEIRSLRGTLDQLARAALLHPDDGRAVEHLVGHAAQMAGDDRAEAAVRDALLSVARSLADSGAGARDRAERVGRLAALLGAELGRSENEVRSIELAARLHCLELVGAAELRQIGSLRDVERIMRGARQGGSRRLRIPLDAQVVGVASAFDILTSSPEGSRLGADAALNELRGDGKRYREEVLDALLTVIRRGSRQRDRRRSAPRPTARPSIPHVPALEPPTEVSGAA
jgi:diguanylate cyclase (GGDEF)-like protein/excisionase family DNA binding protein